LKLFEYEAKKIFTNYGITTPRGKVVLNAQKMHTAVEELGEPVVVKAQILVAGRGKAGGIKFANTAEEAEKIAYQLFGTEIKGEPVTSLFVEEKVNICKELYFALTVDRINRCYVAMASPAGGVDIEEAAQQQPHIINRAFIDPLQGFQQTQARHLAQQLGYDEPQLSVLAGIFERLNKLAMDLDAELVETNPIAETSEGNFVAIDARIIIDDNALFRHPEFAERQLQEELNKSLQEALARRKGLEYVKLGGNIGVVGNGAGLVMATLDLISFYGGEAADFLDIGGGASTERIAFALELLLEDTAVKAALVNILGGITRCDQVAQAIIETKKKLSQEAAAKPLIVRLMGTNEAEGRQILSQAGITTYDSMEQAVQKAVEASNYKEKV
jgi:succinyl-CoA synthetase beta subunit